MMRTDKKRVYGFDEDECKLLKEDDISPLATNQNRTNVNNHLTDHVGLQNEHNEHNEQTEQSESNSSLFYLWGEITSQHNLQWVTHSSEANTDGEDDEESENEKESETNDDSSSQSNSLTSDDDMRSLKRRKSN